MEEVNGGNPSPVDEPLDAVGRLNLQFRALYAANRQELWETIPLSALTLIGTGEIWRVEFGQVVKSYAPTDWIAHAKGLMHGVIAAQATAARMVRGKSLAAARGAAAELAAGLGDSIEQAANKLPPELASPARKVLEPLHHLALGWAGGKSVGALEFSETLKTVRGDLETVIDAAGEGIYASIVRNLQALARESNPEDWQQCLVGVCGVGFARRDNIEIAAGIAVMGPDVVGTRLLYLENAFTIPAGMIQLAAAHADRELGQAVFADPYRMWRDLLGDVAQRHAGGGFFPGMGRPK
jgi:hypothetical protein